MSKRSIPILVGVTALAAAAVLAFLFTRTPQEPPVSSASSPVVQQGIEAARAAPAVETAPQPATALAAQPETSPSATANPEAPAVAIAPVETPPQSAKPQAPKAVIEASPAARPPVRRAPRPPRSQNNGLQVPDFGGRNY